MKVLSIEQMRYLKELGVDTSKASIVWSYRQSKECAERKSCPSLFVVGTEPNWETNLLKTVSVPSFTLQDIIELLPKEIGENGGGYLISNKLFIGQTDNNEWVFEYIALTCKKVVFAEKNIMEAAYLMLCWCAENGYLTTKNQPQ